MDFIALLKLLLSLYLYGLLLRWLLQVHRADFYNPLSQTLVRATDPVYQPVRRIVPLVRGWDLPLLVVALALKLLILYLSGAMHMQVSALGLGLFALAQLAAMVLNLYLVLLIVAVVASWVQLAAGAAPLLMLVHSVTAPLLSRIRAVLPNTGMLDFSPMVALFGIYFARTALDQLSAWAVRL